MPVKVSVWWRMYVLAIFLFSSSLFSVCVYFVSTLGVQRPTKVTVRIVSWFWVMDHLISQNKKKGWGGGDFAFQHTQRKKMKTTFKMSNVYIKSYNIDIQCSINAILWMIWEVNWYLNEVCLSYMVVTLQIHLFMYSIVKFIQFRISYVKCTNVNMFFKLQCFFPKLIWSFCAFIIS